MSTQQPAPHADRDGSERRRSMEREHERALAADVAEPSSILTFEQKLSEADVAMIRSLFAKAERLRRRVVKAEADVEMWRARYEVADGEAKAAEAVIESVEELHSKGILSSCSECSAESHVDWPCPTIRVIRDAT